MSTVQIAPQLTKQEKLQRSRRQHRQRAGSMVSDARQRRKCPEKERARRNNHLLRRRLGITDKALHLHHWSYRTEHAADVIVLPAAFHLKAHRHLHYCPDALCYRTDAGELLDTRGKHEHYLERLKNITGHE